VRVPSKTFPTEIVFAEGFQWLEKDVLVINGAVKILVDLLRKSDTKLDCPVLYLQLFG